MNTANVISTLYLVRQGAVPEVIKGNWSAEAPLRRGETVVIQSHRGMLLGTILEQMRPTSEPAEEAASVSSEILRIAGPEDLEKSRDLQNRCRTEFLEWEQRILDWGLDLQLIDMEWTLDGGKVVLYVLNERGPECTKLALQAAAAGLGLIEVQPVSMEGLVTVPQGGGGGCGSCGAH